ncbi:MAG: hypothetical protein COW85_05660, partial [Ignavibacteria bacterium CG22_combo_CG10-13_8_21_14_all_37_15]
MIIINFVIFYYNYILHIFPYICTPFFHKIYRRSLVRHKLTLIPGDGIGPEITKAVTKILEHAGVEIDWDVVEAGLTALQKYHDPLPHAVIESIDR